MSDTTRSPHNDAVGMSKLALEFLDAAKVLASDAGAFPLKRDHSFPFYYLVAHSIEVMLKSYLRARGFTESELRKLGHDLDVSRKAAEAEGLVESARFADLLWSRKSGPAVRC